MVFSLGFSSTSCKSPLSSRRCNTGFTVVSAFSYQKFIDIALDEAKRHTHLVPSPLQDKFSSMKARDAKTEIQMLSFKAPKIRLLRSLYIKGTDSMQVLDFAVFPEPNFDLPIFCANFFTGPSTNIVVLDLNPLYDVINQSDYKDKYYGSLMPLGLKYAELLPWGGKLTGESLSFFSPFVIWTKFTSSECKHDALYSAFVDYFKAWLELMDGTTEELDGFQIIHNTAAQHRYLTWRTEKDPGHRLLNKLIGEAPAKDLMRCFLFDGVDYLGSKSFLDYFPEYWCKDGTVNDKRSIIGKSFEHRPWNGRGEFIGDGAF